MEETLELTGDGSNQQAVVIDKDFDVVVIISGTDSIVLSREDAVEAAKFILKNFTMLLDYYFYDVAPRFNIKIAKRRKQ